MLESTPSSWLKDELAVTYANHLLTTDRERAFDYALELFETEISDIYHSREIFEPNGGRSSSGSPIPGVNALISSLLDENPHRLLNALSASELTDTTQRYRRSETALDAAMDLWAQKNLEGFADWVISRQDAPEYKAGATLVVNRLTRQKEFEPAMEWAESIQTEDDESNYRVQNVYHNWVKRDPEAATAWRLSEDFRHDPKNFPLPEVEQEP